jgi:hypothetical protein
VPGIIDAGCCRGLDLDGDDVARPTRRRDDSVPAALLLLANVDRRGRVPTCVHRACPAGDMCDLTPRTYLTSHLTHDGLRASHGPTTVSDYR